MNIDISFDLSTVGIELPPDRDKAEVISQWFIGLAASAFPQGLSFYDAVTLGEFIVELEEGVRGSCQTLPITNGCMEFLQRLMLEGKSAVESVKIALLIHRAIHSTSD